MGLANEIVRQEEEIKGIQIEKKISKTVINSSVRLHKLLRLLTDNMWKI